MERETVIKRIRALLAKSVDNGATESEAMAAAAKAKEMMDKYQVSLSETNMEEEGCAWSLTGKPKGGFNLLLRLAVNIAKFCDCHVQKEQGRMNFYGLPSDVEFANWLISALESFCWQQADAYQSKKRAAGEHTDWTDRRDFARGCVDRINERLKEEVRNRKSQTMATGRELVVVKRQIVDREAEKAGLRFRYGSRSTRLVGESHAGYSAGQKAGNRASFGRPVDSGPRRKIAN